MKVVKRLDSRGVEQAGHLHKMRQMRQYNRGVSHRTNYLLNIAILVVPDAQYTKEPSRTAVRNFTENQKQYIDPRLHEEFCTPNLISTTDEQKHEECPNLSAKGTISDGVRPFRET